MDDTARLRQTVRRCTAALVAAIAVTGLALGTSKGAGELTLLLLVAGSGLYLVVAFVRPTPGQFETTDDISSAEATESSKKY